jgi:hypothetical protein
VRPALIAFLLGTLAAAVALMAVAMILTTIVGGDGHGSLELALGPVDFYKLESDDAGVGMTLGPGVALMAAGLGALNAVGARALAHRGR